VAAVAASLSLPQPRFAAIDPRMVWEITQHLKTYVQAVELVPQPASARTE